MKKEIFFFVFLAMIVGLFFQTGSASAGAVNSLGGYSSNKGIGGIGVAFTGDIDSSLFYYNPALLVLGENFVSVGIEQLNAKINYETKGSASKQSQNNSHYLPLLGFGYHLLNDLADDLAIGMAITVPYGMGSDFEDSLNQKSLITFGELNLALAYQIQNLNIGWAVKYGWAEIDLKQDFVMDGLNLGPAHSKADGGAFSWQLGAVLTSWEPLTLGFSYQSKAKAKIKGETKLDFIEDKFISEFVFPSRLSLGFSYKFNENLTVGVDITRFDYDSTKKVLLNFKELPSQDLTLDWESNIFYALGVNYVLPKKEEGGTWSISSGASWQKWVIPDSTLSPATPDASGWAISFGFNYLNANKKWRAKIASNISLPNERRHYDDVYSIDIFSLGFYFTYYL